MIDVDTRRKAAFLTRRLIDGSITNFEFDDAYPRGSQDGAVRAVEVYAWHLYSDVRQHKLTGRDAPGADVGAVLARCVLFLERDLEFEWPVPSVGLGNIFAKFWLLMTKPFGRATSPVFSGDTSVWPFYREADYRQALGDTTPRTEWPSLGAALQSSVTPR